MKTIDLAYSLTKSHANRGGIWDIAIIVEDMEVTQRRRELAGMSILGQAIIASRQ